MLGEIVRVACSKRRSGTSLARDCEAVWVVWWIGQAPAALSGRKWQGSQPCQSATELVFPGPALWKMQGEAARRAGEASGHREEASSEGLGGYQLLTQTEPRRPAGQQLCWLSRKMVTVQICGDLGTIRPLVEGQPSTEFPLQTVSVPSNVNSYERWAISAGHEPRHVELFLTMAFRMVSSLRMQATKATFFALPAASSLW